MFKEQYWEQEKLFLDCQKQMQRGSKSFSLASRLFPENIQRSTVLLYSWCRYCDDQIDEASSWEEAVHRLSVLRSLTEQALLGSEVEHPVFKALTYVVQKHQIPKEYFFELLKGMQMDIEGAHYRCIDDLRLYCFRVAGVVGLMLAHIMGVSDKRALKHAADLGMAMQMTNISRDVREDYERGRIYLPSLWLSEAGAQFEDFGQSGERMLVYQVVQRLLNEADVLYRSGRRGLDYLNFRSALTIAAALLIYSRIGQKVLRKGTRSWDERVYTGRLEKLGAVVRAALMVMVSLPQRLGRPWRPVTLVSPWRYQ